MYKKHKTLSDKNNKFLLNNKNTPKTVNLLCDKCNNYQKLKIEKLSTFEPKSEVHSHLKKSQKKFRD